jgi:integrase
VRGTVYNRGTQSKPNYWLSWDEGLDANGRRLRKSKRAEGSTKKEAQAELAQIVANVNGGTHVATSKLTVAGYVTDVWLPSVRPSLRESTLAGYSILIHKHVIPGIGGTRLQKLTVSQLDSWYASLLTSGRRDGKGGLSRKTVANIHRVLRKALGDAVRKGLLSRNVGDFAQVPKDRDAGHKEMATWSGTEVRTFLDFTRGNRLHPAFVVAAATGMRRGELLGLRWTDLDLKAGRLSVRQTLLTVDNRISWSTPKTPRSRRSIDLDKGTVGVLRSWRKAQAEERLLVGAGYQDNGLVFCNADGTPLQPASFSRSFERLVERSGLPAIRLHDLRHTHATLALAAGLHPKVVSERLGHSTVSLTLDVYSHAVPGMQRDAAEQIAALFMASE